VDQGKGCAEGGKRGRQHISHGRTGRAQDRQHLGKRPEQGDCDRPVPAQGVRKKARRSGVSISNQEKGRRPDTACRGFRAVSKPQNSYASAGRGGAPPPCD
jgi:hypothetical protein